MRISDAVKECLAKATDEELAQMLEDAENTIAGMRELAHQIRNVQHKRIALAWEARNV